MNLSLSLGNLPKVATNKKSFHLFVIVWLIDWLIDFSNLWTMSDQRWKFIKENKKVRKQENKNSSKKAIKKTRKQELGQEITFLVEFLFSCFLSFMFSFIKFPTQIRILFIEQPHNSYSTHSHISLWCMHGHRMKREWLLNHIHEKWLVRPENV